MPIENHTNPIETLLSAHNGSLSAQEIQEKLSESIPLRTLQYQLKKLVQENKIIKTGNTRSTQYHIASLVYPTQNTKQSADSSINESEELPNLSVQSKHIQRYVRQPVIKRKVTGYDYQFLNRYRPNHSAYLSEQERQHLKNIGTPKVVQQPAGTYAKHIMNRLLIDLSWNSSRLEGNTYSLLDSRRLIDFGKIPEGHQAVETQMILNHKDAIEFLVGNAEEIGFNRYTVLNLHALLANNLLADPMAVGKLRHIGVGIEQSAFLPLEVPQLIESYFNQILSTAAAIKDPFEQSFFMMVQLPYLQPFDDVNKRVSRLAANIPLIKHNLCPLSFVGVPQTSYIEATIGVYEMNDHHLLKDVFIWAYERSAERYAAVRQSLGEPDPLRLRYRDALKTIVSLVINQRLARSEAFTTVATWSAQEIDEHDRDAFQEMVEEELLSLHEGNFARYAVRPSAFEAWQLIW